MCRRQKQHFFSTPQHYLFTGYKSLRRCQNKFSLRSTQLLLFQILRPTYWSTFHAVNRIFSPPTFRFRTEMWHPNIYENGDVCISILHPPVDDPQSGELPSERWNPTQNVRTVLLSVISLLNEPNTFSPGFYYCSLRLKLLVNHCSEKYQLVVHS